MPRIYLPSLHPVNNSISITGEKVRYLTSVLRCRKGDDLTVFDSRGNCFRTAISKIDRREVVVEVREKLIFNPESSLNIILAQALLKGEKMDLVIQKATELGVKEIKPVVTVRSQLRETRKVVRWRKIAEEASRQSGRSIIPLIHEPVEFADSLESEVSDGGGRGIIFYEEEGISIREAIKKIQDAGYGNPVYIFIGPEGGFTKEEIILAKENGLIVTSLGKRILRAETAAISAVVLLQFLSGDMN